MTTQPIPTQPTDVATTALATDLSTVPTTRPSIGQAGSVIVTSNPRTKTETPSMASWLRFRVARVVLGRSAGERSPYALGLRGDRGSATIEAVIAVTTFGLFIAMTVAGGRIALAHQGVETAANDAARAASIARTSSEAIADARTAAVRSLEDQDIKCATTSVQVDTSGFSAPTGTTAQVTATISCTVKLADLAIPGMPGSRTITETVSSPIDAFRERR